MKNFRTFIVCVLTISSTLYVNSSFAKPCDARDDMNKKYKALKEEVGKLHAMACRGRIVQGLPKMSCHDLELRKSMLQGHQSGKYQLQHCPLQPTKAVEKTVEINGRKLPIGGLKPLIDRSTLIRK